MAYQVVITDCPWSDISIEQSVLAEIGAEVRRFTCAREEEVIAAAHDADALLVGWAPITGRVIQTLSRCRVIVRYGAGYNNVDVEAATAAGIGVANNAEYCVDEVATHALSLLLACHRQLMPLTHDVRRGVWDPMVTMTPMPRLSSQTVGIAGYGRIGRRFAELVRPLVQRVLIYDPAVAATSDEAECRTWEELLAESDYVSLHAPLTPSTQHMVRRETIELMKPSSYLINCSRGPLVDEIALAGALRAGRLAGAALDVFETEPLPSDHPFRAMPNVILTPHAAWFSRTADYQLRSIPAGIVRDCLHG